MNKRHALGWAVAALLLAAALRLPLLTAAPPGLHYDEAANAILSGDIGLRGERPIFIESYTGKETLFFYAAGGMMAAIGESVFALRLTAALAGLLTVAVTYRLGVELFRDRRVALIAMILLAASFWHLQFSRLGFRAVTQPLLQGLCVLFLLVGWRTGRRGAWVGAGLFLGATAYTYLAARLFPILLLLAAPPLLAGGWPQTRRRLRPLLVVGGIGAAVLGPLLWYFYAHPDAFWVRIQQVGHTADTLTLGESVWRSLRMFAVEGDPYWRFNIPDRPLFHPFWAGAAVVGGVGLWRGWPQPPFRRFGWLVVVLAPAVMLLPTALATNEIVPSNLRAIGMLPFVLYWPAVGLVWAIDRLPQVANWEWPLVLAAVLLGQGTLTADLYFEQWAPRTDLFYENNSDLAAVAAYVDQLDSAGPIFVAAQQYQHPTVAFLADNYDAITWLVGGDTVAIPPEGTATYVFPHSAPRSRWMAPVLETAAREQGPPGPDGRPLYTVYRLDGRPPITPTVQADVNYGYAAVLRGYDLYTGTSGQTIPLTLHWEIAGEPAVDLVPFVQVEDEWGYRWGQTEAQTYPTAQWRAGQTVIQHIDVPLRPGAPADFYRLRVGLFDPSTQQPLARFDENGRFAGTAFFIETVPVLAGPPPDRLPGPPQEIGAEVWPGLTLLGYEPGDRTVTNGERLWVSLWWLADETANRPLPPMRTRLELVRTADGTGIILGTQPPAHGRYPFPQWQPPQFVISRHTPDIPLRLPAGEYRLVGRVLGTDDRTLHRADLGRVTVTASDRTFTPPQAVTRLDALFGGEIRLWGYTAARAERPDGRRGVDLQLVWRAEERPSADYAAFVHLLRPDGTCCAWQLDLPPGDRPTSGWLMDEVVTRTYNISLPPDAPPGEYRLEVGLYLPDSGQRLAVRGTAEHGPDYVYLPPIVVPAD